MFFNLLCKHEWMTMERATLHSPFQQISEHGMQWKQAERDTGAFFSQTWFCIMVCKKCGKIDKTVVRSNV